MQDFIHDKKLYYSPVEFAFSHISGTWKIPILLSLEGGPVRYGDLKSRIPHITDKMLHTQLRELESKRMISRKVFREKPPRVEYALMQRALDAFPTIEALKKYGELLITLEADNIEKSTI
ncbi:DNA-binding HxlR family transcriptional regulator [Pedobacter sp. W3I1]|uniref:winged helix-turn-helix transcriptional regulator n=1 Tax=Pedobacter sp. W3I1 TaxID=3042291 RepID=UPI0027892054|nr:helix-turn-helix domain-containing protein [Pedobacter sp. W3I1]MDQ0641232.1 DNA-binding HxlR family transcriptional regulator [Pedobacter sp. W3I1]